MSNKIERTTNEIIERSFHEKYQDRVGWFVEGINKDMLHNNSKELLKVLKENNILVNKKNFKLLEIGAGGCRNLKYILDEYPKIKFYANDLHQAASFKNMHESIREVIHFYEGKTQDIIKEFSSNSINLLIDSDHLVHINYTDTNKILDYINNTMKPNYFLVRSITIDDPMKKGCPYHKHNFNKKLTNYKEIFYKLSDNCKRWYIKIFKLNI